MNTEAKPIKELRIVFLGTPDFAVSSLAALLDAGCNIVAVVTSVDKESGRGLKMHRSAVKEFALQKGLKILQPDKLKDSDFLRDLRTCDADLQIVVAFRMLPEVVWNMPKYGTINLHASLLPQYRGAAPINWKIINGEIQTGVTTFKLQHQIDTGDILLQEVVAIGEDETAGELYETLKKTGAELLVKTILQLAANRLNKVSQSSLTIQPGQSNQLKAAPKIFAETCQIDWSKPVNETYNLIRGLSPSPGAFTLINGKHFKILRAKKNITPPLSPNFYRTDGKTYLQFRCADGYLEALEVQLEGKRRMMIPDFLRGYN